MLGDRMPGPTVVNMVTNTFTGVDGIDYHVNGTTGADTITTANGNDFVDGKQGDDLIVTGVGNDQLVGGPGNDSLDGGAGNDTITGSAGNDVVQFHFNFTSGGEDHVFDLAALGPNPTQNQFSVAYTSFLSQFGHDVDADGTVTVFDLGQNGGEPVIEGATGLTFADQVTFDVVTGSGTQERTAYLDVITGGLSVTSNDGQDVVMDFDASKDALDLIGLTGNVAFTETVFDQFFKVEVVNADGGATANDVKISLVDDSWSVTLLNPQNMPGTTLHDIYTLVA